MCTYKDIKIPVVISDGKVFFALPELRKAIDYKTYGTKNCPKAVLAVTQSLKFPDGCYHSALSLDGCRIYASCAGSPRNPNAFREDWDKFLLWAEKEFPEGCVPSPLNIDAARGGGSEELLELLPEEIKAYFLMAEEFFGKLHRAREVIIHLLQQADIKGKHGREAEVRLEKLQASLRGVLVQSTSSSDNCAAACMGE